MQAQGFNVNPDDVNLPGKLDRIDTYQVTIKFAEDLSTEIKVWVAPDPESKAAIDAHRKAAAAEKRGREPPRKPRTRDRRAALHRDLRTTSVDLRSDCCN